MRGWVVTLILLVGCGKSDTSTTPGSGTAVGTPVGDTTVAGWVTATGSGTGTGTGSTSGSLPSDPRPVSIVFSGAINETIAFDTPTCSNYPSPALTNFRTFWRGASHNAVLIAEVLTDFTGAGSYDTGAHNLRVKLQTEAGTVYTFDAFAVDTAQGDSATMTVDHVGNVAYGEFSFTGMHSVGGAITAAPATIPIWCETVEN